MGRLNLRMDDELIGRVKAVCGDGGVSGWFRELALRELGGRPEDRVLARLDKLEDFQASIELKMQKRKQPAVSEFTDSVHVELDGGNQ